jgi:hypothetical protein
MWPVGASSSKPLGAKRLLTRDSPRERRTSVRVYGCSPGCLLMSLVVSLLLTIVLNVLIRLF